MMHTDDNAGQSGRIDPVYSETDYCPAPVPARCWLYPRGEYEAFALARMRRTVKHLKLLVGYPGVFRPPVPTAWFRRGDAFNPDSQPQRHANFLAVLSGVAGKGACARIAEGLLSSAMPEAGTPYMISLEILALHELGRDAEALAKLRRVWGGMLRLGATTFFEGYRDDFDEETMCVFYDRPFGMSLCHAWSAAPCALLPILTGRTIPDNCQMLCRDCNRKMG